MRVIFMGTPAFALPTFEMLLAQHDVRSVYTRPDKGSGRGRKVARSVIALAADAAGVEVRQPVTLRGADEAARIAADRPDVIVVAAFGAILPSEILAVPRLGCINVHASLLPRWRGAAPVQHAILAGDAETGVSIMKMETGLDTGPWCVQRSVTVGVKTAADLTAELASLGASLLESVLRDLEGPALEWHVQDESAATYAAKVTKADVALVPELTVKQALARVRAAGASAPSRLAVMGRTMTVLSAHRYDGMVVPGMAVCEHELVIGLADGAVRLDAIVPEGRSPMSGEAYIRGARLHGVCEWSAA